MTDPHAQAPVILWVSDTVNCSEQPTIAYCRYVRAGVCEFQVRDVCRRWV